ncbi:trypsin-like peptidase domain-containing protein [Streptomyces sp. NPDC003077]|uniref:VMAP-C domain-containing protein n=1 Tax=Streptomyces sp. NPDC003077 TaxID=3154443 RepID=UPI0033BE5120
MTTAESRERVDRERYARLLEHAGRTTVALRPAPGADPAPLWGSGVLIAPGWVLTCAHVLTGPDGQRRGTDGFGVAFGGRVVAARLEYDLSLPVRGAAGVMARPDLALVRLLDEGAARGHACAWVSDQPAALLEDAYIFRGHDRPGADGPGPDAAAVDPFIAVRFGARDHRGLQFGSDVRVTPGASGGPLLDCDRGEVVGIVKGSHREDRVGLAVPVTALRELGPQHLVPGAEGLGPEPYHELMSRHDHWHWTGQGLDERGAPTWFDAQHAIMAGRGRLWGVQERLQALDLLAGLPAPRDPLAVAAAVGEALGRTDRSGGWSLRTWRDGHGALYQGSDPYTELVVFVHYLRIVAQHADDQARGLPADEAEAVRAAAERLAAFVRDKAVVLRWEDRARIGPVRRRPDSVLVELEPLYYGDGGEQRFNWSVSLGYGRGRWLPVDIQESAAGMTLQEARAQLVRHLGPRLLQADADAGSDARVRLEVAVPEGYWDLPVDRWELPVSARRTARTRPIGPRRPVVLRDQGRRQEVDPAWLRRWRGITGAVTLTGLRLPPHPPAASPSVWRTLEEAEDGAVLALCRTVADGYGLDAVGQALDTGYAVGLWLSSGHGERECDEACEDFHRQVRGVLAAGGVTALPELVRELRGKAEDRSGHWARDLILFYDDPENPIPELFAATGESGVR